MGPRRDVRPTLLAHVRRRCRRVSGRPTGSETTALDRPSYAPALQPRRTTSSTVPDVATAYDLVLGLRHARELLADLEPAERALRRLRATPAEHEADGGVYFDSRAWIITARRP